MIAYVLEIVMNVRDDLKLSSAIYCKVIVGVGPSLLSTLDGAGLLLNLLFSELM